MNIAYLIKTWTKKGRPTVLWSDTEKTARIHSHQIPDQPTILEFYKREPTLEQAIFLAYENRPKRDVLPPKGEVTFYEPIIYDKEHFFVEYVIAKR